LVMIRLTLGNFVYTLVCSAMLRISSLVKEDIGFTPFSCFFWSSGVFVHPVPECSFRYHSSPISYRHPGYFVLINHLLNGASGYSEHFCYLRYAVCLFLDLRHCITPPQAVFFLIHIVVLKHLMRFAGCFASLRSFFPQKKSHQGIILLLGI